MPTKNAEEDLIDAHPTKEFFVDMITIDIPLEQAVLDLVDNSIDAANRTRKEPGFSLGAYSIHIEVSQTRFEMRVSRCTQMETVKKLGACTAVLLT